MTLLLLAGCARNPGEEKGLTQTFKATSEFSTRTSLDGLNVLWSSADCISVFSSSCTGGEIFTIDPADDGKSEASFSGSSVGDGPWYAIYPGDGASSMADGAISLFLPGTQHYSKDSFGSLDNPMVAVSSTNSLAFKNLCGVLVLKLKGSGVVKSISLTTSEQEALWGQCSVSTDYVSEPELVLTGTVDEPRRTLTLDCAQGVELGDEAVQFYFVLPPGTLSGGFSVSVSDAEGNEFVKESKTSLTTSRGSIKRMADLVCKLGDAGWLGKDVYGVYDISGQEPVPVRVFGQGDQLALRSGNTNAFRIQSLAAANALIVRYPSGMTEGGTYDITLESVGTTGVTPGQVSVVLVKSDGGKLWLEDAKNKLGYIIAGQL